MNARRAPGPRTLQHKSYILNQSNQSKKRKYKPLIVFKYTNVKKVTRFLFVNRCLFQIFQAGMHLVGKGSWKKREVGIFKIENSR